MIDWRVWLIPILVAAAGCERRITSRIGVQVVTPLARARDDGTRETPLGGAAIRIWCPNGAAERLGSTDSLGWVLVTTRAPVGLDCNVAVDYRGRPMALVPVAGTCSRRDGPDCRSLEVRLELDVRGDAERSPPVALPARCEAQPHGDRVRCRHTRPPAAWDDPSRTFTSRAGIFSPTSPP